jgi:hypothetical protein
MTTPATEPWNLEGINKFVKEWHNIDTNGIHTSFGVVIPSPLDLYSELLEEIKKDPSINEYNQYNGQGIHGSCYHKHTPVCDSSAIIHGWYPCGIASGSILSIMNSTTSVYIRLVFEGTSDKKIQLEANQKIRVIIENGNMSLELFSSSEMPPEKRVRRKDHDDRKELIVCKIESFDPLPGDNIPGFKINCPVKFGDVTLSGEIIAQMKGRLICRNVMNGKCVSCNPNLQNPQAKVPKLLFSKPGRPAIVTLEKVINNKYGTRRALECCIDCFTAMGIDIKNIAEFKLKSPHSKYENLKYIKPPAAPKSVQPEPKLQKLTKLDPKATVDIIRSMDPEEKQKEIDKLRASNATLTGKIVAFEKLKVENHDLKERVRALEGKIADILIGKK